MYCPSCGNLESKVVDSRPSEDGTSIRRRRECLECGHRFTTYERLGDNPVMVMKSDGSTEVYNREKLMRGLTIACAKRSVAPDDLSSLVADIEAELRNKPKYEVTSKELGDMALERLASIDEVAFVRFASVYQDFQSASEFAEALERLR